MAISDVSPIPIREEMSVSHVNFQLAARSSASTSWVLSESGTHPTITEGILISQCLTSRQYVFPERTVWKWVLAIYALAENVTANGTDNRQKQVSLGSSFYPINHVWYSKFHSVTPIQKLCHDPLRMVGPCIFPKLADGDEDPAADAPCWQPPRRDQVV